MGIQIRTDANSKSYAICDIGVRQGGDAGRTRSAARRDDPTVELIMDRDYNVLYPVVGHVPDVLSEVETVLQEAELPFWPS